DHIRKRRPQRTHIQITRQPQRQRRVERPPQGVHPAGKPQPPLSVRERDHLSSCRCARRNTGRRDTVALASSRLLRVATVGASKMMSIFISRPKAARIRLASRVASSECPPRSKKLSCTPTCETPSISAK